MFLKKLDYLSVFLVQSLHINEITGSNSILAESVAQNGKSLLHLDITAILHGALIPVSND